MSIEQLLVDVESIAERIERAEKYEEILSSMGLGILETDGKGQILHLSTLLLTWLDDEFGDSVGRSFADYVHPADLAETMRCFAEDIPIRKPFLNRYISGTGDIIYLEWIAAAIGRHGSSAACRRMRQSTWERASGGRAGYGG